MSKCFFCQLEVAHTEQQHEASKKDEVEREKAIADARANTMPKSELAQTNP